MKTLEQSMRWYGPADVVSLSDIRQAGATAVVTALHHIPNGEIWSREAISERKNTIETAGLRWSVVESVPVHEDIKTRSGNFKDYIDNYKKTIENLGSCGVAIICYNFMPVLDWTRTDLGFELPDGGKALRFEKRALTAFDCFILERERATESYNQAELEDAMMYFNALDEEGAETLKNNILAGLPGSEEGYNLDDFRKALKSYEGIDANTLATNLELFLSEIIPTAEKAGVRMAIHPDDPPFPILGLPRVVSTTDDYSRIFKNGSTANGMTFCTGSLGVRKDNDLIGMVEKFGDRIHFVHLRSTQRDAYGNFMEAAHLEGDVPMYEVVKSLMTAPYEGDSVPMRPDHGHQILDDLNKSANPGYTAIGRLKGLAELRGLMHAIEKESG